MQKNKKVISQDWARWEEVLWRENIKNVTMMTDIVRMQAAHRKRTAPTEVFWMNRLQNVPLWISISLPKSMKWYSKWLQWQNQILVDFSGSCIRNWTTTGKEESARYTHRLHHPCVYASLKHVMWSSCPSDIREQTGSRHHLSSFSLKIIGKIQF